MSAILDWEGLQTAGEFESRYLRVGRDPERGEGRRESQGGSPEAP
ncbi:MAG TPA: hypothetical protein VF601_03840 [Beijerinckiaceae bacterium]